MSATLTESINHNQSKKLKRASFPLLSVLYVLFSTFSVFAQASNCVEGDFVKGIGKSEQLIREENKLCAEIGENSNLQEIHGFVLADKLSQIVRVYKDKTVFTDYEDRIRYKERNLTVSETKNLRQKIDETNPAAQPFIRDSCIDGCTRFEFLTIDRNGGRRVSIFSPAYFPPKPMDKLAVFFRELGESGNFKIHYYIQDKAENFELLFADNVQSATAIWKNGGDFRVLVRDNLEGTTDFDRATKYFDNSMPASGAETYEERLKRLKRRSEIKNAHYSWRKFEIGRIGENASAPDEIPYFDTDWRFTAGGYQYFNVCGSETDCALVRVNDSAKPIVIKKGDYDASDIVVSPDNRWMVVGKEDKKTGWETLVRINLQTKKEFPVKLELSSEFDVVAYIPAHNKFLIRQTKFVSSQKDRLFITYLLDADTGKFEKITGDFSPLLYQHQDRKPLQPTQNPNTFWVAKHDYKGTTQFGIYDIKSFTFQLLATWSDIEFDSNSMWIDEKDGEIYFVYGGHLLALPLPKK